MKKALDQGSFERLFREEFNGMVLFAFRYIKDRDAAREIVQEAFVNLWNKREEIDRSRPWKSYLITSVKNRALNWLRDHKKFDTNLLIHENLYPTPVVHQPSRLDEVDLKNRIELAINELPDRCLEIFVLSRNDGLKCREIADKLNISVKTVETQMSKALEHMRQRLKEDL